MSWCLSWYIKSIKTHRLVTSVGVLWWVSFTKLETQTEREVWGNCFLTPHGPNPAQPSTDRQNNPRLVHSGFSDYSFEFFSFHYFDLQPKHKLCCVRNVELASKALFTIVVWFLGFRAWYDVFVSPLPVNMTLLQTSPKQRMETQQLHISSMLLDVCPPSEASAVRSALPVARGLGLSKLEASCRC